MSTATPRYEDGYNPKYGYNANAFVHKTIPQKVVGHVVRLIATPIGLVSEAIHSQRDKKQASAKQGEGAVVSLPPDQADALIKTGHAVAAEGEEVTHELVPTDVDETAQQPVGDGAERDEEDWVLDEVIASDDEDEEEPQLPEQQDAAPESQPIISTSTAAPLNTAGQKKLPFPVILPQRRPGTKTRGFVRAYAPVLADSGIDEAAFLTFLSDFHRNAQASPIFDVIMIGTGIAGFYPDIVVGLSLQAVQIVAGIGQEMQERWRTNRFLEKANQDIFVPRGLFAVIVTYKKDADGDSSTGPTVRRETVNLAATAVAKFGAPTMPKDMANGMEQKEKEAAGDKNVDEPASPSTQEWKEKMKRLRLSSGKTHGEAEMPVMCAPLIFPALEDAAVKLAEKHGDVPEGGPVAKIKDKAKGASGFVADYFDRRAQANYAFQNPNSTLTAQMAPAAPRFKSRFADPQDGTNKHLITLITGGKIKAEPLGARRRWEKAQRKAAEKRAQGLKERPRKRLLQEDVLYLMVVNMPTEAELAKARRDIEAERQRKKDAKE